MKYEIGESGAKLSLTIEAGRERLNMPSFLVELEFVFVTHIIRAATKKTYHSAGSVHAAPGEG